MKSFFNEKLIFFFFFFFSFLQEILGLLHFGLCQNCKSSVNLLALIHQNLWNKRLLSTGEPCTCEYTTLVQSFHRGTLSTHRCKTQNFQRTSSMSVLFTRSFKTAIFSRFLKITIATSNFINKIYNGGSAPEFIFSMLKETIGHGNGRLKVLSSAPMHT